eukprot:8729428-Pyramimonas_sp.AAC.1
MRVSLTSEAELQRACSCLGLEIDESEHGLGRRLRNMRMHHAKQHEPVLRRWGGIIQRRRSLSAI